MTKVMIADACKPSLVMTSEVFKDKIAGTEVLVASTGTEALEYLEEHKPDLCVVDFDLPDVDGPALVEAMRRNYNGPILMTAYPGDMVKNAVNDHLFAFNDASDWLAKPISFDELSKKIERFLVEGHRLGKRFQSEIQTLLIAKAAGRGKRAPKVEGKLTNISLGGACVQLEGSSKIKKDQEFTVSFSLPKKRNHSKPTKSTTPITGAETKIKATVAWSHKGKIGLQFSKLTDPQKKSLEQYIKTGAELSANS